MDTKPKTSPRDFFLYLAAVITLYVSAGSLLSLLFDIINAVFPDALYNLSYSSGSRFAIASLIIVFPVYVFISWMLRKDIVAMPERKEIWVRKWLTYLNLFVTGAVVIGDLITLLNVFLSGEISARFLFKVLAVLIVAGAVFAYYLYDLRRSATETKNTSRGLVFSACGFVLASIVGGFIVMGSPTTARNERFDNQRASDLQSIQSQIVYSYFQQKGSVPESIEALKDPISGFYIPVDPETQKNYGYQKTGTLSFKLCADFKLDSKNMRNSNNTYLAYPGSNNENWTHPVGTYCFDRTIDKDLYPIRKGI